MRLIPSFERRHGPRPRHESHREAAAKRRGLLAPGRVHRDRAIADCPVDAARPGCLGDLGFSQRLARIERSLNRMPAHDDIPGFPFAFDQHSVQEPLNVHSVFRKYEAWQHRVEHPVGQIFGPDLEYLGISLDDIAPRAFRATNGCDGAVQHPRLGDGPSPRNSVPGEDFKAEACTLSATEPEVVSANGVPGPREQKPELGRR